MKRIKITLAVIFTALLLICSTNKTFSAEIIAVSNGAWHLTTTWDGGIVPTADDDVIISGYTVTLSTNQFAQSVTVETSSTSVGKLIVTNTGYLTASADESTIVISGGEIENAGTIDLLVSSSGDAITDCIKYIDTTPGMYENSGKYSGNGTLKMDCSLSLVGSAIRMSQTKLACYFNVGGNYSVKIPDNRPFFNIAGTSVIGGNGTITAGTSASPAKYMLFMIATPNSNLTIDTNVTINSHSNLSANNTAPISFITNVSSPISLTNKATININGTATQAIVSTIRSTVTLNNQGNINISGNFTQAAIGNGSSNSNSALNINNTGSFSIAGLPASTTALNCQTTSGGTITFTNDEDGNFELNIANTSTATSTRSRINNGGNVFASGIYNGQFDILTGGMLTVYAGNHMSINGAFNNSGTLNLMSNNANGTATIITPATIGGTGTYNVQQFVTSAEKGPLGRNWYISSPLSRASTNIITAATGNRLEHYEGGNWVVAVAGARMDVMKGYVAISPAQNTTIEFKGGTLNTGDYSLDNLTSGFHLVGNPYPSYVDFEQATKTNIANSIWYRSKKNGAYNFHTYNVVSGISVNDGTPIIPPMQGFWIKAIGNSNSFGFTNAMRLYQDQTIVSNRLKAPKVNTNSLLRLQVSSNGFSDETVLFANENTSRIIDEYDTQKMFNNISTVPELFTVIGSTKLAINGLSYSDFEDEIALGFATGQAGTFSIKASEFKNFAPDKNLYLIDKLTNTEFDLTDNASYVFESEKVAANTNRFALVFRVSGTTTSVDNNNAQAQLFVYANPTKQIVIKAPLHASYNIYNTAGQLIESGKMTSSETQSKPLAAGVYIVKTDNETKRTIIK